MKYKHNSKKAHKIHVDIPNDLHLKLRIKSALEDTTMSNYLINLLDQDLREFKIPEDWLR
ncbi:hypothetical protein [Acanthopleuribacter pedis]|uniref:Uncharacterized protein n=1 Tax=Acanthopleuribacter pedis TaxID=442870 RepID=A0A8J7Q6L5_9BACT|nr:hypothetical protein [Acanthopleuribacter pedis]MBO1317674.1 hypothetical protein [Acanthopleuribacter pedis]